MKVGLALHDNSTGKKLELVTGGLSENIKIDFPEQSGKLLIDKDIEEHEELFIMNFINSIDTEENITDLKQKIFFLLEQYRKIKETTIHWTSTEFSMQNVLLDTYVKENDEWNALVFNNLIDMSEKQTEITIKNNKRWLKD